MVQAANKMVYRFLGKTGIKVSVLGFGNMFISEDGTEEERVKNTLECLNICKEAGVNYFDTAETYGNTVCETTLGKCLEQLNWDRKDYVISTKIIRCGDGVNDTFLSRKHIVEGLTNCLKRLKIPYVDVVFAHRPDYETPMEEICRAFNFVINQGMAFYWGTSEWEPQTIMQANEICEKLGLIKPIVEQTEYNMLVRKRFEVDMAPLYDLYGYGTTIWGPVASGFLTGKYNSGVEPEESRYKKRDWLHERFYWKYFEDKNDQSKTFKKLTALGEYAKELGVTQAQLALAWALRNTDVSVALIGASKPEQIASNLKCIELYHKWTPEIEKKCHEIMDNDPVPWINWRTMKDIDQRRLKSVKYD